MIAVGLAETTALDFTRRVGDPAPPSEVAARLGVLVAVDGSFVVGPPPDESGKRILTHYSHAYILLDPVTGEEMMVKLTDIPADLTDVPVPPR